MSQESDPRASSTKPYLLRALHEWCTDNGLTPYMAVKVDDLVNVPIEHVRDGEIVLNVGYEATNAFKLGNDYLEFKARFGGVVRDVMVPISHVLAIYAKETGQGMGFPPPESDAERDELGDGSAGVQVPSQLRMVESLPGGSTHVDDDTPKPPTGGPAGLTGRPQLKRVK